MGGRSKAALLGGVENVHCVGCMPLLGNIKGMNGYIKQVLLTVRTAVYSIIVSIFFMMRHLLLVTFLHVVHALCYSNIPFSISLLHNFIHRSRY